MKRPAVFTIAAGADFARQLAQGLLSRLGGDALKLSSAIIYLPTRRATRSFGEAFAQACGGATLLPQFKALGESDEDELLFDAAAEGLELLPAIAPLRRQLLLARLIRQWDSHREGALSFAQAAALADSLAKVMDEVETQGCDLARLKDLAPPELAAHWEGVTRFLDVLHEQWPAILAEEQKLNPAARRNQALKGLAQRLTDTPPPGLVIAAGSTGSVPATAELLKAIALLPDGAVVLPGLDRALDAASWADLDPGHPQYGLSQLLKTIGCDREDVRDWGDADRQAPRVALLRETLRPAPTTDAWRALAERGAGAVAHGLDGLSLLTAADPAQEALAIALALRHALETPDRTAALVTPDRNLARRVAAEMARWDVTLDDSAGRPLAHTTAGAFLCLVAEAAQAQFAPVPLLALLKHPFATCGEEAAAFRARARELDRLCLRGPRPDVGLDGIARAIRSARGGRGAPPDAALDALAQWWNGVAAALSPLEKLFSRGNADIEALLDTHVTAAQALAGGEEGPLWRGDDGEAAFGLIASLKLAAENLSVIEPGSWPALFRSLAMKTPVRGGFGRHPRLAILGPLEARLQRFDLTILGGLNEGVWPGAAGHDPWFSRPMRASLGLEQPERSIGLAAHDFAMLAAGPQVILSRSLKADGAPTVASRWLQRLEQLTQGLKLEFTAACDYARLAAQMGDVAKGPRMARPAPRPPAEARPRRLSVTEIETWLRDPYAIYAKHVLKLRPLKALDDAIGPLERGTALHRALELFIERHEGQLPDDAAQQLAAIADQVFAEAGIPRAALAVWRPRFFEAAQGFIVVERARRASIARSHTEVDGRMMLGDFELRGVADRIDVLQDGRCAILDYKSGAVPSIRQVEQLLSPQLPLEAAILDAGGFGELGKRVTEDLVYLSLADGRKARKPLPLPDPMTLAAQAVALLTQRIARYADPATPYYSRVRPLHLDSDGDYDHLARVREWSAEEA